MNQKFNINFLFLKIFNLKTESFNYGVLIVTFILKFAHLEMFNQSKHSI